jgi:regulator of replication initiation timing
VVSNVFKNGKETSDFVIKYQSQIDKIWNELENPNKNNSQSTDINQINNLIVENNDLKERLAKLEQLFLEGNIPESKKNNKLGFNPELLKKQLK